MCCQDSVSWELLYCKLQLFTMCWPKALLSSWSRRRPLQRGSLPHHSKQAEKSLLARRKPKSVFNLITQVQSHHFFLTVFDGANDYVSHSGEGNTSEHKYKEAGVLQGRFRSLPNKGLMNHGTDGKFALGMVRRHWGASIRKLIGFYFQLRTDCYMRKKCSRPTVKIRRG